MSKRIDIQNTVFSLPKSRLPTPPLGKNDNGQSPYDDTQSHPKIPTPSLSPTGPPKVPAPIAENKPTTLDAQEVSDITDTKVARKQQKKPKRARHLFQCKEAVEWLAKMEEPMVPVPDAVVPQTPSIALPTSYALIVKASNERSSSDNAVTVEEQKIGRGAELADKVTAPGKFLKFQVNLYNIY